MTLDDAGESFIKSFEGFSLTPYPDVRGRPTIGWGHTQGVTMGMGEISDVEAEQFFEGDVAAAEKAINLVTIDLNQNEFNALVSFAYNEGTGAFLGSTMFQKLNNGDRRGAAKEFLRWVYYKDPETENMVVSMGLQERRQKEMFLFLSPSQE